MLQQWAELLDEFRGLPPRLKPLPTFLEFSGCKRKEEVYSDILAFYLDPGKPHGLGTLFLDALVQAGGIPNHGPWTGVSVEREKRTHNGNRIDILIESDNHVIVIENKIFAPVDNPFDDYKSFAETLEPPGRRIHVFLLTLTSSNAKAKWEFLLPITYEEFLIQIRELLGKYVAGADTRYLTFMLDVLNTLDHLQGGVTMDPCFRKFLEQNFDAVEALLKECYRFKSDELHEMASGLRDGVGDGAAFAAPVRVRLRTQDLGNPGAQNRSLGYEVKYFITRQGFEVNVRAIVSPEGWEIRVGQAGRQLEQLLKKAQIGYKPLEAGRQSYRYSFSRHEQEQELPPVAPTVRRLIEQLAGRQD